MNPLRTAAILAFAFPALCATAAEKFESSFWVWNRGARLTADETLALRAQNVRTLYWHAGELTTDGAGKWRSISHTDLPPPPAEIRVVPVIRITPETKPPFGSAAQLAAILRERSGSAALATVQLDFDCPERFLRDYAQLVVELRNSLPEVSVTALAHWIDIGAFAPLQQAADEIVPMFYDLDPDPVIRGATLPLPAVDDERVASMLQRWSRCSKPWRAGLPSFARLTLYDRDGKSRGHIRNFSWADVCFNPALATRDGERDGTTLFRATAPTVVANTPVAEGELVAARWPDRRLLERAVQKSKAAGAAGVLWFRLPQASDASGWSLRQIGELMVGRPTEPALSVRRESPTHIALVNGSDADLPPRLSGNGGALDRGYALELDASAPIFREAGAGDFWKVIGHIDPDRTARAVAVSLATRVTLWFSDLRARESLRSGLIALAPEATLGQVRYRILNVPGADQWRQLE